MAAKAKAINPHTFISAYVVVAPAAIPNIPAKTITTIATLGKANANAPPIIKSRATRIPTLPPCVADSSPKAAPPIPTVHDCKNTNKPNANDIIPEAILIIKNLPNVFI